MAFLDVISYAKHNNLQKLDVSFVLKNYLKFLQCRDHDTLMDIGTGDGSVLVDFLLPKLPNHGKVVALDICEDMLKLAKNYSKNPKMEYVCMDIATRSIPRELHGFDHIFSFFCLQWVAKQRLAMKNIFTMLKPGGDILLILAAKHSNFVIFEKMAKLRKWSRFMTDVDKLVSPYLHCSDPAGKMGEILRDVGFVVRKCEVVERRFVHESVLDFRNFVMTINPFIKRIPEEDLDEYKEDYLKEFWKLQAIKIQDGKVFDTYQVLVVAAAKPDENVF